MKLLNKVFALVRFVCMFVTVIPNLPLIMCDNTGNTGDNAVGTNVGTKNGGNSNTGNTNSNDNGVIQAQQINCPEWSEQWSGYNGIKIGLVVDKGFFSRFKNNMDALMEHISLVFMNTNSIFVSQLNTHIELGDVLIGDKICNYGHLPTDKLWWNDGKNLPVGCDLSGDQLQNIRQWLSAKYKFDSGKCQKHNQSKTKSKTDNDNHNDNDNNGSNNGSNNCGDSHATWVYLADCYFGSGLAPVGTLCWADSFNAAVVNYEAEETWITFAHELGHIFGESHYFDGGNGGIMDYNAQMYNGLHQFRYFSGLCNGIKFSQPETQKNRRRSKTIDPSKPNCWHFSQNWRPNEKKYIWTASGTYSQCFPAKCSDDQGQTYPRFRTELIKCVEYRSRNRNNVDDSKCDVNTKPLSKFVECGCPEKTNGKTNSKGNRGKTSGKTKIGHIDAAFTDTSHNLYQLVGEKVIINGAISASKLITDVFKNIPEMFTSDIEAAFVTKTNILYLIKKLRYIRYDLTKNSLIDTLVIKIKPRNDNCEFGRIPTKFWECGQIDAAFSFGDNHVTLICGNIGYTFNMNINGGFDNMYRPFFQDLQLDTLSSIDAASYDQRANVLRLYFDQQHIDLIVKNDIKRLDGVHSIIADKKITKTL